MIDPTSITPGFLSASAAETLQQTAEMTVEHGRLLAMFDDTELDHFPARLTAYDSTSGAYSCRSVPTTRLASGMCQLGHARAVRLGIRRIQLARLPPHRPTQWMCGYVVGLCTPGV
jgi:hypothetical protein